MTTYVIEIISENIGRPADNTPADNDPMIITIKE